MADDDPIICQGLSMILSAQPDLSLLGVAENGEAAVELCRRYRPDAALLDIRMPKMDGIAAAEIILREGLSSPLLLTTFDEPELIGRALQIGACGYILKNSPTERILSAISTIAQGGTVFGPDILDYIRSNTFIPKPDIFSALTSREKEIVGLVAKGLSNSQIAERLFLSNGTVRNHISAILEKTGLAHRTQIAVKYYLGI
jgi:DNA-binding NarL/FixJ family response regulator